MKTTLTIALLITVCFAQDAPPPSRWFHCETARDGMEVYLERRIQTLPNGNKKRWVRFLRKDKSSTLHLIEFDCKQERQRFLQSSDYNAEGEPQTSSNSVGEWTVPVPDSIAEALMEAACPKWKISPEEFLAKKRAEAAKAKKRKK